MHTTATRYTDLSTGYRCWYRYMYITQISEQLEPLSQSCTVRYRSQWIDMTAVTAHLIRLILLAYTAQAR